MSYISSTFDPYSIVSETETAADNADDKSLIRIEYRHSPVNIHMIANTLAGTDFAVVSPYLYCNKTLLVMR